MSQHPDPAAQAADIDAVPGDPPVPVNVWRVPAGQEPIGDQLAARLLAAYTRPRDLVYDTLPAPGLRKAAATGGRLYRPAGRGPAPVEQAALAVAGWPIGERLDPVIVFGGLRRRLRHGGILAVIITGPDGGWSVELGPLVEVATAAGLSYLQHIVTMPAGGSPPPGDDGRTTPAGPPAGGAAHQRVHQDILVFARQAGGHA